MSPGETNITLQTNFVRREVQTGRRMLDSAITQRKRRQNRAAMESLGMANVALSVAKRHLAAVKLPVRVTRGIMRELRQCERRIRGFTKPAA
jgi:hypothetical protein